jgi:hypothetical protein
MDIERQSAEQRPARRPTAGRTVAVTGQPAEPWVRVEAVPAAEVLVGLAASAGPRDVRAAAAEPAAAASASPALRAALRRVGPDSAEVWLHLLGLAVEAPAPRDGAALVRLLDRTAADELLRHALGYHVPAWRAYVDGELIAAAAAGDRPAQRALLGQPRYYAGQARTTLRRLLRLGADGAAGVLREAVRGWYAEVARRRTPSRR